MTDSSAQTVRQAVRDGYKQVALTGMLMTPQTSPVAGCCGGATQSAEDLASKLGYSVDELRNLPQGANMGLSCGNPAAIAALAPGQTVVDLGSGGGFDAFLAGPKVGSTGKIIGVDMTPEMLDKARKNLVSYTARTGLTNVEFRLGEIEHLPIADSTVDVIISNCVLNLSVDKAQVWREIGRVLKPAGRVAVSDIALFKPLPLEIKALTEALVGCIAGAVTIEEYRQTMRAAGLSQITLTPKPEYIQTLSNMQDPLYQKLASLLPAGESLADYVTSLDVSARKAK